MQNDLPTRRQAKAFQPTVLYRFRALAAQGQGDAGDAGGAGGAEGAGEQGSRGAGGAGGAGGNCF
ncbi:MAG: hypothetical protein SW833_13105 [Cyanobacteriota bacterium]|nr:hypothetical protein [Cyanobacteriota bacterium]